MSAVVKYMKGLVRCAWKNRLFTFAFSCICLTVLFIIQMSTLYNMTPGSTTDGNWVTTVEVLRRLRQAVESPAYFEEKSSVRKYFYWPAPDHPKTLDDVTDPLQSSYNLVYHDHVYTDRYRKGDNLVVRIIARNGRGEQKRFGGDFIKVVVATANKKNSIVGRIEDNNDGTYIATVPLVFEGSVLLSVILIHPSEAVDLLRRVTSTEGSPGLVFHGVFRDLMSEEERECNSWLASMTNATPSTPKLQYCNFTHKKSGEPWYCEKPKFLDCNTLQLYKVTRTHDAAVVLHRSKLFNQEKTLRTLIGKQMKIKVGQAAVNLPKNALPRCTLKEAGSLPPHPGGYFLNDVWKSSHCAARSFASSAEEAKCLKNKIIYLLGDSTIRQWYSHYVRYPALSTLSQISSKLKHYWGHREVIPWEKDSYPTIWEPREAVDPVNNITFRFSAHGPPLQNGGSPESMPYIADRIDKIPGGPDTKVAITMGTHMLLYDPSAYVKRLDTIRGAIKRLLRRAPDTLVVFKGFNVHYMDDLQANQCCLFDWLSYRLDTIARNMFKEMRGVVFLDSWDLSASHYSIPGGLHTQPHVVQNEVALFMSFVCPN